jgi:hypothetical protein
LGEQKLKDQDPAITGAVASADPSPAIRRI